MSRSALAIDRGDEMAEKVIAEARAIGFTTIRLDTLPIMSEATRLHQSMGFVRYAAYYQTPLQDTIFMELNLGG